MNPDRAAETYALVFDQRHGGYCFPLVTPD
ncbi:hypothetical protein HDG35_006547 [Paraburkholderia sp. JPY681]|nr:hypothetical protein [Paraburkholderia atlantica]